MYLAMEVLMVLLRLLLVVLVDTYSWSPSGGTAATCNWTFWEHTVTVTDANSCTLQLVTTFVKQQQLSGNCWQTF
jgi:hypothetical protein